MMQFALISLIPGLISSLQDCADPALDQYSQAVSKATSLKTSERTSCTSSVLPSYIRLMLGSARLHGASFTNLWKGTSYPSITRILPDHSLQGSFFGPYTPLQQLDILADHGTKSYVVGSTNSLLLQQKDKYSDILINLDENSVNITSTSLRTALSLSAADRRWIDFLTQTVQDTWDPAHPDRPHTMGYAGSEEFIRLQFEEYLLALLSSVSYHNHSSIAPTSVQSQSSATQSPEEDPSVEFNPDFIQAWKQTSNYALFTRLTSGSSLFDIIEAKHPTAGGLSVEDIQRRLAQQVAELHLDERVREGRETLGKHLAIGRERFGQFSNKIWADIEGMREAQRKRASEEGGTDAQTRHTDGVGSEGGGSQDAGPRRYAWPTRAQAPDLTQVQATAKDASVKAGAYLSSWGSWARDKGKEWQEKRTATANTEQSRPKTPPTGLLVSTARPEKSKSTLSPTGSDHSEVGRLSAELAADRSKRWSGILRKGRDGGSSTAGSADSTQPGGEGALSHSLRAAELEEKPSASEAEPAADASGVSATDMARRNDGKTG
jgi:Transport protein Avl9